MMKKFVNTLVTGEKIITQIFLFLIIILVFVAAVARRVGYPLVWSVDLAQLLFAWTCFLGADLALQQDRHIGVDIFVRWLPKRVYGVILFCSYVLILGFLGIIMIFGTYLAFKNSHRLFNGMPISYSWATISAPVGCLLLARTIIGKMIGLTKPAVSTLHLQKKSLDSNTIPYVESSE
jgi:TRAP-type C4-dicarboxylate transport system permease small subunit